LPEWCQEKIAVAKSMLVAVWDYMESEEDSEEVEVTWSLYYNKCDYFVSDLYSKLLLNDDLTLSEQLTKKSIKKNFINNRKHNLRKIKSCLKNKKKKRKLKRNKIFK
jgi:hypothetical protein